MRAAPHCRPTHTLRRHTIAVFSTLGVAATPLLSALATGLGIGNLVLGGRIMRGSDGDATTNGVVLFGGWAILSYVSRQRPYPT